MALEQGAGKVYAGEASLKFTSPAGTNNDEVSVTEADFHQVDPSETYTIEFYAKVPSGVIHMFVNEKQVLDGPVTRKDMQIDAHMWAHADWTKFTQDYTPSEGVEYARLEFYNWNEAALEGYIDNVVFRKKTDVIPEPIVDLPEVKQPYDIGVFYFSNWNGEFFPGMISNNKAIYGSDSDWFGGIRDHLTKPGPWGYGPIPDREPLIGWYDDRQQQVLDNHILEAASRGIDHFAFYYYWKEGGGGPRPGQNIENYKTSPYRNLMSYYLYFVADGSYDKTVWKNEIVPKLISFMQEPSYKKTEDGRPIVGFFGDMEGRLGGSAASLKEGLDYLRSESVKAGLENPLLLYDGYRTLDMFIEQGYDGFLPLNLAGIGLDIGVPQDYASAYPDAWKEFVYADYSQQPEYQNYEDYLFIPGALNAFDVRPWGASSGVPVDRYVYADPSPEKFKQLLNHVKEYLDTHERSMNMATLYAWNEWGEGGSIEPNSLFGYGYIDAIQEVYGLNNSNYKLVAANKQLGDIAPDLRMSVEPDYSVVTEGQNVNLKVRIKNYSDSEATGTLSLNANGWEIKNSTGESFTLGSGDAANAEFNVTVQEGELWNKHSFTITANYGENTQEVSTFVVKAAPFYVNLNKDSNKKYKEYKFDVRVKAKNYTLNPKTVNYQLVLPDGWTANSSSGEISLSGFSGTGSHAGRTIADTVTITYPETTESGKYTIRLITTDGEFSKTEDFTVEITELFNLLYNGSFEIDENNDGIPDVWSPGYAGGEMAIEEGTEENPAPMGQKYVRVNTSIPADGEGGYVEKGIKQEGTKTDVNWLLIDPMKKYELSFWAKVEEGAVRAADTEVGGIYYNGLGAYNSSLLVTAEDNGNEWKQYKFTFYPNPQAGRISVRFHAEGEPGDNIVFYLDGVVLKEVDVTPEENMIVNGGMETDTNGDGVVDGWATERTGGSLGFGFDWQDQYGGIRSQKISGTNAAGSNVKQEWFDVVPGKLYIVEFWAKVTAGTFTVVSAEKAGENGQISYNSGLDFSADTWQKYTYSFRPKAGMTKQSLRFLIKGNETSTAWIDNVVMRPDVSEPQNPPVNPSNGSVSGTTTEPKVTGGKIEIVELNAVDGIAEAVISTEWLVKALNGAPVDREGKKTVSVVIPAASGAVSYKLTLPASTLSNLSDTTMEIVMEFATIRVPGKSIAASDVNSDTISWSITKVDPSDLDPKIARQVNGRPVLELNVWAGTKKINGMKDNAAVTVSFKYEPKDNKELLDKEFITVWRLLDNGEVVPIINARYDAATKEITFTTTHFGKFTAVYVHKTFRDLDTHSWAKHSIEVMASKGIINGTSADTYNPSANITRADFLKLLIGVLDLRADITDNFTDVDKAAYYYDAIGTAKALGIVNGIGESKFNPAAYITRQDAMVMTARALKLAKRLKDGSENVLTSFNDAEQIANYARASVASLVVADLIEGSGDYMNPASHTTRAEAAVMIYRLYNY
ncbi:hypothetical protein PAT3040_05983 [Paenibacillus agaridevorans]|uniref:SLH domain-containing protein n=2 Tax=Paenibacillus agaridevorans TaxID=171404 RepID=A0A2R5F4V3_9BACL|nr:hypothetical protein PAT3040_05983 [Paenibacillus agaridevorans]